MRISLSLESPDGKLSFPVHYNREVQGMIYRNLDQSLADWLHDEGSPLNKRSFKFFNFSRLMGRFGRQGDRIEFSGPVKLHIGSVHQEILQSLAEHLLRNPVIRFGGQACEVQSIEVEALPALSRPVNVRTLSPITVYSTLSAPDGRKKTYYYSPQERDWGEKLLDNLRRKARAIGWSEGQLASLDDGNSRIRPVRVSNRDLKIIKYQGTVIKAWSGIYQLDLPEPFFLLAYDSGLGSKNSQGFGMVEVVKGRPYEVLNNP
jgi:CRISPR-associated endoribonuclease Cas6